MGTSAPVSLSRLIRQAANEAPGDPLAQLSAALELAGCLNAVADNLVDHFVAQARDKGCSWTQIGGALGVSKQAAQQRFLPFSLSTLGCREIERRLTPRAHRAIRHAHREARRLGIGYVDTDQLLLGLLGDGRALASRALEDIDVRAVDIKREMERRFTPRSATDQHTGGTLTPASVTALQRALAESEALGHNYIGTEHLLLGLLAEKGVARDGLLALGADYPTVRTKLLEFLAGPEVVVGRKSLRARLRREL